MERRKKIFYDQKRLYPEQLKCALSWLAERMEETKKAEEFYTECLSRPNTGTSVARASRRVHQRCLNNSQKVLKEGVFGVLEIIDDKEQLKQFGVGSDDVPEADIISAWHPAAKIFYDGDFEEYFEVKL